MTTAKDDFDVAKNVSELLNGIEKTRQQRILRWVCERLELDGIQSLLPVPPPAPPGLDKLPPQAPHAGNQGKDIKTFINEKKPNSDVQFATAVAYYYRFEAPQSQRKESIGASVLLDAARLADYKRPKKALDALNNAKKRGYLDGVERGLFQVNAVGENLVTMSMPGTNGIDTGTSSKRKKVARRRSRKGTRG